MSRAERFAWIAAAVGLILGGIGWLLDPPGFYAAWLAALILFAGWPLGSMALLLTQSLTGGRWGEAVRPGLLMGVRAMPLVLPAVLPLLPGLADLYPWARRDSHVANAFYLNVPFFAVRGVIYFVIWFALGALIARGRDVARIAPAGLFVLAISTSFAAIDTTMSLDPAFNSSVYGMLAAAGMCLLALSMAVLMSADDPEVRGDLGSLLLALVILWIYLDFMQLLIVWQSDLAKEAPWYLDRSRGFWGGVRAVIAMGHFALPFALLLAPGMRRSFRGITGVAALLVAMEVLRAWWTVLPSPGLMIGWIDVACMTGLGGLGIGFSFWSSRRPLLSNGLFPKAIRPEGIDQNMARQEGGHRDAMPPETIRHV